MSQQVEWVSHPVFDVEQAWTRNYPCPVPVSELADFQRRLDALTGKTVNNLSRLKVVWGMAADDVMFFRGQYLRQHPHWREEKLIPFENPDTGLTEVVSEIIEIGVPRFYMMELNDREDLMKGNGWDSLELGPIPENGFYTDWFLVAHHDAFCCKGAGHFNGVRCLGSYRPPGEQDLDRIRQMLRNKNNARPDEIEPSIELAAKRVGDKWRKARDKRQAEMRDAIKSSLAPHAHTFTTDDPSVLSNGKYHFLGGSKQPKGTE